MTEDLREYPHYSITAAELAAWLDSQPDCWWLVDGDPVLTGRMDFPCPSDELSDAIRKIGKPVLVLDEQRDSQAKGERIGPERFAALANRDNRLNERTFLCAWEGSELSWVLSEDTEVQEQNQVERDSERHGQAAHRPSR